jgi:hypothetical protein
VVGVEGLFTWSWRAALGVREGIPFVLGPALYMKAIQGGHAQNARLAAQKLAILRRGGLRPQAYVSPAEMRATRDLLRRRIHLLRKRAAWLTHSQTTKSQYHRPEIGKKLAYQANRHGIAERLADPAVPKSREVDLALLGPYDEWRRDIERSGLKAAKPPDANARSWRRPVPGLGESLRLVLLYEMHDRPRFPRGQDFVSSGRLVKGATESAGTR